MVNRHVLLLKELASSAERYRVRQHRPVLACAFWRHLLLIAVGTATLVSAGVGCGNSPFPTPPSDLPGGCGLGRIPVVTTGPEPCLTVAPRCPARRPSAAQTLVWVGTCSFRGRDAGCEPIQLPGCPRDFKFVDLNLVNLNRDESRPCVSAGQMHIDARATAGGGARLLWDAQERDATSCESVGPEMEGEAVLEGPCCSSVIDVYFPAGNFTVRIVIRTDWQP